MSASYYQHVLATEGRTDQLPACQVLITRRREQDLLLLPTTQVSQTNLCHKVPDTLTGCMQVVYTPKVSSMA